MSIAEALPKMTPMYATLWYNLILDREARYSDRFLSVSVGSDRIGMLITLHDELRWLHVCHPVILHRRFKYNPKDHIGLVLDMQTYTRTNYMTTDICLRCGYELNQTEQLMMKMVVLGVKR